MVVGREGEEIRLERKISFRFLFHLFFPRDSQTDRYYFEKTPVAPHSSLLRLKNTIALLSRSREEK